MIHKHVYVYEAIRRTKENPTPIEGPKCIRYIDWDEDEHKAIKTLQNRTQMYPGVWRIYRTVNKRNVHKALNEYIKLLTDIAMRVNTTDKNPETLWRNVLCNPCNKSERVWLLDYDLPLASVPHISDPRVTVIEAHKTPNGWALLVEPFNTEEVKLGEKIEIKRDGLLFISREIIK